MAGTLADFCRQPEFVGCTLLDTIGLVISSVDASLKQAANIPDGIAAVGLLSSRTGAAGQILAADEAVKNTGCIPLSIELPRDTKGWGGHGNFIVLGGKTPADARRAVELALAGVERNAGEVYISQAGHLEFAYSASAGPALQMAFDVPPGAPFGFAAASPAAIGFVLANRILKEHSVELLKYLSPDHGTRHSNEVIVAFTGETSDVKSAVMEAKTAGMELLTAMGSLPESPGTPYIV